MKTPKLVIAILLLALLAAACGGTDATAETFPPAEAPTLDPAAFETAVAATVAAELTQIALENPSPTPPSPTDTPEPGPTLPPTETPEPSPTISDTALEDHALFVADVTIPDGTEIIGGETFTKTWRLRNIGTNTWTTEYSFVFVNGDRMEGTPINFTAEVLPGGTVDISIPMVAPLEGGTYEGFWMLADADGAVFGIGITADQAVLVSIVAIPPTATPTATATSAPTATPTITPTP